jgi:homoserine O-succinyltransferase/O-acetyltransferase
LREASSRDGGAVPLDVAFINNMPDQALAATQAQFHRLLATGAGGRALRIRNYFLPSVARSDTAKRFLAQGYDEIDALYARGADAILVTGAEPRAGRLPDEPYWCEFTRLVDWAREHTVSAAWSCLAAHAAVLRLAGVERVRRPQKISGVYEFDATRDDWITRGGGGRRLAPHSRYNDLPRAALEAEGFNIAAAGAVGVDLFWRREPSLFLFMQGHPEYDADTLAREYRRDMLRFLNGEGGEPPQPPENYFTEATRRTLDDMASDAQRSRRKSASRLAEVIEENPPRQAWREDAERLYRNWLDEVAARKSTQRKSA